MAKKILVTGAAGFVGSHLVEKLVEKGENVICIIFNKDPVNHLPQEVREKVQLVTGDIRNKAFVEKVTKGCSQIYHLAATLNAPFIPWEEFYSTNVIGTRNIMDAALKEGVKKVVVTSSVAAIKETAERISEEHRFKGFFDSHYALTKFKAEKVAFEYGSRGVDVVVLNPTIIYGPREIHTLGEIFRKHIQPPVRLLAFKKSILNLIYVEDAADGFILAMAKGRSGHRYILGGPEMTLGAFVGLLDEVTHTKKPIITLPSSLLEFAVSIIEPLFTLLRHHPPLLKAQIKAMKRGTAVDISKSKKELGVPERSVKEGVRKALEWYKKTGYIKY